MFVQPGMGPLMGGAHSQISISRNTHVPFCDYDFVNSISFLRLFYAKCISIGLRCDKKRKGICFGKTNMILEI